MGILNLTPDSFYTASRYTTGQLRSRAAQMLDEGATILDVGGYSSRPGATNISVEEELNRVMPAIEVLHQEFPEAILSVDTFRAEVARQAISAGAHIINDISGGQLDANMYATVAKLKVPYIMMHMRGTPQTMVSLNQYNNLLADILEFFSERLNQLRLLGVKDIIADPGFGFAKNIDQNFFLLKNFSAFYSLGIPMLAGLSRKSLIYKTLNTTPEAAQNGTTVLNTLALTQGAAILRAHDVRAAAETIKLVQKTFF